MESKFTSPLEVRRRVTALRDNPIVKSELDIDEYNSVCKLVETYGVFRLTLGTENVVIDSFIERTVRYPKNPTLDWLERQIKDVVANGDYIRNASISGTALMTVGRSNGIADTVEYALSKNAEITKEGDWVTLRTPDLMYKFCLANLHLKARTEIEERIKLKRLQLLVAKYKL